jgi:NAD(P)H-flavin reductase
MVDDVLHGFYTTVTFIDEEDLDKFVRHHVPDYCVPERWNYVPTIPLTSNGKVNKATLVRTGRPTRNTRTISTASISTVASKDLFHPVGKNAIRDPENGRDIIYSSRLSDFHVSTTGIDMMPLALPPKNGFWGQRWLKHRGLIVYRKLFTIAILANLAAASVILYRRVKKDRPMLADIATAMTANLTMAIAIRSEPVINLLFTIFSSVPTSWPLAIRKHCARIFHLGGIHSGCAIAATLWFAIFTVGASVDFAKGLELRCITMASMVLTYIILVFFIAICSLSHPSFRAKYHDIWEMSHRFGSWTMLILIWIQTFLTTKDLQYDAVTSSDYLHAPSVWLLTVSTIAIVFPWLFLRKVPVRSEVISSQAIRLHFDYATPVVGTSVRIAERPWRDWHSFATITNPSGKGFSLIVSTAGNFTQRTIDRAPSSIFVRGTPTCGVLRTVILFKSIVLVANGAGIGPCLAVILAKKTPCRIIWTADNPEETFGKERVDAVLDTDPNAIIHNTGTQGNPDTAFLAWKMYQESKAEAVYVIGDRKTTTRLVYAMETRGVPAYGNVFDF